MAYRNIVWYVLPATWVWLVVSVLKLSSIYSSNYFQHKQMQKHHPSRCQRTNPSGLWHPLTQHLTCSSWHKIPTAQQGTQASYMLKEVWVRDGMWCTSASLPRSASNLCWKGMSETQTLCTWLEQSRVHLHHAKTGCPGTCMLTNWIVSHNPGPHYSYSFGVVNIRQLDDIDSFSSLLTWLTKDTAAVRQTAPLLPKKGLTSWSFVPAVCRGSNIVCRPLKYLFASPFSFSFAVLELLQCLGCPTNLKTRP